MRVELFFVFLYFIFINPVGKYLAGLQIHNLVVIAVALFAMNNDNTVGCIHID
jgi:hypothetical protein